eukprot:9177312-Pyramimonas_sp.AAC.2
MSALNDDNFWHMMHVAMAMRGPYMHLLYYIQEKSIQSFELRAQTPTRLYGLVNGKGAQLLTELRDLLRPGFWSDHLSKMSEGLQDIVAPFLAK